MKTLNQNDELTHLDDNLQNDLSIVYANDDLLDFGLTLDVTSIELPPVEKAEAVITNANQCIGVLQYLLESADSAGLGESEHANAVKKDIGDLRSERNELENAKEKFQGYRQKKFVHNETTGIQKLGKKIFGNNGKTKYDRGYEKVLGELNTQINKVNLIINRSRNNKKLLESDIENYK